VSGPSEPPVGAIIAGRYEVLRTLGRGGMGIVYEAFDSTDNRRVALKLIRPDRAANEEMRARFLRERDVLLALHHPAIVELYDAGALDDGSLYLAMEMLRGETLGARVGRIGPMHPGALAPIITALGGALDAAHARGVIHRDVKPANVYLLPEGADVPAKLLDFGVARTHAAKKRALTRTGSAIGTLRYMPPEQITGRKDLDKRADIYALGAVVQASLTGKPPFRGPSDAELAVEILSGQRIPLSETRPDLPPAFDRVVGRAMALAPENRYDSTGELAADFAEAAKLVGPPPAPPPLPAEFTVQDAAPDERPGSTMIDGTLTELDFRKPPRS
jgi:serine/threonine-protein kinase